MRQLTGSTVAVLMAVAALAAAAQVELKRDDAQHQLAILADGKAALVYHFEPESFLPYFHPVNSPSGKELTIKQTDPYPHHRSFWFADTVLLEGEKAPASFYNAFYSFKDGKGPCIRHARFAAEKAEGDSAALGMELLWELAPDKPVLKEARDARFLALGNGEWFLDIRFTVTAEWGDVHFRSDAAHYAWPYIRIHPQFSVERGGTLLNSEGGLKQAGTHGKPAKWCDYTNTLDGKTEGLAFFSHAENEHPHTWLTRDYGTFGPRRADPKNGKPFTLKKGESLAMRVGVLVHNGDAKEAKIAERYNEYVTGRLSLLPPLGK
ncbi:MAG TPA: PmoA family protein [Planctomycetota bacterium]|nr:PmoA family protein [Planctomycetota bacterium]HRT93878.1 PmoA family protein [Planctomycetota bacterium]